MAEGMMGTAGDAEQIPQAGKDASISRFQKESWQSAPQNYAHGEKKSTTNTKNGHRDPNCAASSLTTAHWTIFTSSAPPHPLFPRPSVRSIGSFSGLPLQANSQ
jgi:hypothetical protein